ncbi:sugar ABC transporter ATP-binding protein [Streptomyces sp. HNM0575]|uniref:sugar ABC transporter ATP-binding protein n=1 Tax=Streptomyces sp. HNM0575 TaxID=2716338 RepID=UPI00145E2051|nr:sugar ABC transporter ATP-binding protein [Streptomyces sp. HNM0575]NLU71944.1 sugar ABC transporter ATP-binding protein [Streptomyces sp. HNM0575]
MENGHDEVAGSGAPPLLSMRGVAKSFPGVRALRDMRLDLRHGEVLALVGENGAGKSTLMKLLSGIHTPDAGEFVLDGEPVRITGPRHAQRLGVSIIHQEFNLMPDLTVAQNIFIGREPRGRLLLDERALNDRARELIERLELPLDPRRRVGTLTVAQQQMVEIAKALSYDAKVLIMDEPTAALNDAEVRVLHALIRRFTGKDGKDGKDGDGQGGGGNGGGNGGGTAAGTGTGTGTGVIYISHRMEELKSLADRITVIRDGEYVDTLPAAGTPMREVVSLMVGRELDGGTGPQGVRDDRETVLTVDGLSTKDLLKDVSLELKRGEILGLAGLMGAGRTELARALVGADPVTAGTVTLDGRTVRIGNPADAARHGIGYLSEDRKNFGLLLEQDVATNIGIGSLKQRFQSAGFVDARAVRAAAEDFIGRLGIRTPSAGQTVKHLSGGNQQKVVIAKWLLKDCDILVFDEPTRGIDVGAKEEIHRLVDELAQQGKSLIVISSDLPEVLRMSHRVLVMCEGRVTGELSADEATQEKAMHYATLRTPAPGETADDSRTPGSASGAPPEPPAPEDGNGRQEMVR